MSLMLNRRLFQRRDCLFKNCETTKREKITFFNLWSKNVLNFIFWIVLKIFLKRLQNLKTIKWEKLKTFRKRFRNLKKTLIDETTDFENVVNENFASLKTIFLMFLNDYLRRLKTLKSEKIEKKSKTCLFKLSDNENFVDEMLIIK